MPSAKRGATSLAVRPPLPLPTAVTSAAMTMASTIAPRTSAVNANVSEDTWAQAIHAVKVQKMSLRSAAQLYGVHHMSLHRRVRGRYANAATGSFDIRLFLSEADEAEVLGVLREQFLHERRITSDDIRFVVRAIASHGGQRAVPPEFPPSRWIVDFKRAHGFAKLNSYAYPPVTARGSSASDSGDMDDDGGDSEGGASSGSGSTATSYAPPRYAVPSFHRVTASRMSEQQPPPTSQPRSWDDDQQSDGDREDFGSNTSSGSYDNGTTTGSSCGSFESSEQASVTPSSAASTATTTADTNSNVSGSVTGEPSQSQSQQQQQQQRSYKLSHTVPPETWDKAIAAVEQQGMSLRAAARAYGVHFAALHRRVKKRAQGDASAPLEGYFHPDDEAGIIRVVVARAELGVLMTFDELMDLVQRAALRNLPDISVDAARKLMARFQSRNEHSVRHIVVDWPLPRISAMSLSGSGGAHAKASSASITRAVRGPSRPAVIVTNTIGDVAAARAVAAPFGVTLPSTRILPPSSSLSGGDTSAPALLPSVAPLRGELQSSHSLFLRAPPPPPSSAASSSAHGAKRNGDKGSSIMFV